MSIEYCPRCSARVRVPAAAESESWVRCPRCRAETQLGVLLAAEVPELELLDGPSAVISQLAPMMAGGGGGTLSEFDVMDGETLVADEDSPTMPFDAAHDDNLFGEAAEAGSAGIGTAASDGDDELFGFDDDADAASLRTTSEDGKYIGVPEAGDGEFAFASDGPGDVTAAAPISTAALGAGLQGIPTGFPRRKKKSGLVPMMIGVVGGGIFGLLIAYYGILMWWKEMDPFKVARYFPESMQILLPASLQDKFLVKNNAPPIPAPQADPDIMPMPTEEGNLPNNDAAAATAKEAGETGSVPGLPGLSSADPGASAPVERPATDPLDPLSAPGNLPTPKPSTDPLDPFGNNEPAKPIDPLALAETPVKPAADPLDPLGNIAPVKPEMPKPEATTPAPADPLDPLAAPAIPLTPEDPLAPVKPEATTPAPVDPLTPKPADPLDPLTPKPVDPLATTPADPLAPVPAMPKANEPLMLASASFAPEELDKSLAAVTMSHENLMKTPDDEKTQVAAYRALSRLGEVAGQLKNLGETPEQSKEHLAALAAASQKLTQDPMIANVAKLTPKWLSIGPEKRNSGIVLYGAPGASEPSGKLHRTSLDVPGSNQKLTVYSEHPLLPNADGKIALLGVIVEKPSEQIPGYTGADERVIWASVATMDKPAVPANDAQAPEPAPAAADDPFGA